MKDKHPKYPDFPELLAYEQPDNSRSRIVNAAIYLFSKQGYPQTATKAIAELADVSEALVFKLFKSKSALLEAVFIEIIQERLPKVLLYGMEDLRDGTLPIRSQDQIAVFLAFKFKYILKHVGYFKILFQELQFNEQQAIQNIRKLLEQLFNELETVILTLQRHKIIRSDMPPKILFRSLAGALNFLLLDYHLLTPKMNIDLEIQSIIQLFLEGAAHEKQK